MCHGKVQTYSKIKNHYNFAETNYFKDFKNKVIRQI